MIIQNNIHNNIIPVIMESKHYPVIVSNIGVSSSSDDVTIEIEKAKVAIETGADIISDLSLVGDFAETQKYYLDNIQCPLSIVSVYETYANRHKSTMTAESFIRDFENQVKRGVDLITLHATVFKEDYALIKASNRLIPTTSRGGVMMLRLICESNYDNPYYLYFEDILKIAKKYSVCISLGPTYRPGSVWDCQNANDLHLMELHRMGELVRKAEMSGVGIAVEGIGHAPLNLISKCIDDAKKLCYNAPYRVLTVSTDIAIGYDHIASAISSANAVYCGADSITCVTRSEHKGLPSLEDIRESVICAKIAAESGFRARNAMFPRDFNVSKQRQQFGCCPKSSDFLFNNNGTSNRMAGVSCGMCGEYCPFLIFDNININ